MMSYLNQNQRKFTLSILFPLPRAFNVIIIKVNVYQSTDISKQT